MATARESRSACIITAVTPSFRRQVQALATKHGTTLSTMTLRLVEHGLAASKHQKRPRLPEPWCPTLDPVAEEVS